MTKTREISLQQTRKGCPALWEWGGGYSNTGDACIIAGPKGEKKSPVYVRRRGHLAGGEHALFVIKKGDVIVFADHHRLDYNIEVCRIIDIQCREDDCIATIEVLDDYRDGEWAGDAHKNFEAAIEAAKKKAACYHCRSPHYARQE